MASPEQPVKAYPAALLALALNLETPAKKSTVTLAISIFDLTNVIRRT
jgi:hypothetical protein